MWALTGRSWSPGEPRSSAASTHDGAFSMPNHRRRRWLRIAGPEGVRNCRSPPWQPEDSRPSPAEARPRPWLPATARRMGRTFERVKSSSGLLVASGPCGLGMKRASMKPQRCSGEERGERSSREGTDQTATRPRLMSAPLLVSFEPISTPRPRFAAESFPPRFSPQSYSHSPRNQERPFTCLPPEVNRNLRTLHPKLIWESAAPRGVRLLPRLSRISQLPAAFCCTCD